MSSDEVNLGRRRLLTAATAGVGGIGVVATAVPFLSTWNPSARAQSAGAPVEADISKMEDGAQLVVKWRGKPVWIVRRDQAMLDTLPKMNDKLRDPESNESIQPDYCKNATRSIKPEYLVAIGICTHLGCSPSYRPEVTADWMGGFYCPCHGSMFDLAARVFKGVPAPTNLVIPPHQYVSDAVLLIGEDGEKA